MYSPSDTLGGNMRGPKNNPRVSTLMKEEQQSGLTKWVKAEQIIKKSK